MKISLGMICGAMAMASAEELSAPLKDLLEKTGARRLYDPNASVPTYPRGAGYAWQAGDGVGLEGAIERCEKNFGVGKCETLGAIVYPKCSDGFSAFGCCICKRDESVSSDSSERQTTVPSPLPTVKPTHTPAPSSPHNTHPPTFWPTFDPTDPPTFEPTVEPTVVPTPVPTPVPSKSPSFLPTLNPTENPISVPPTKMPTQSPTRTSIYGRGTGYAWKWGDGWSLDGAKRRCENDHGVGNCESYMWMYYPVCEEGYSNFGCCICKLE